MSFDHPQRIQFERFMSWAKDQGTDCDRVGVQFHSLNNRSFKSTKSIKEHDTLIFLPADVMISEEEVMNLEVNLQIRSCEEIYDKINGKANLFFKIWVMD